MRTITELKKARRVLARLKLREEILKSTDLFVSKKMNNELARMVGELARQIKAQELEVK